MPLRFKGLKDHFCTFHWNTDVERKFFSFIIFSKFSQSVWNMINALIDLVIYQK